MIVKLDTNSILGKLEELCTDLLNQDAYKELKQMFDQFAADEPAVQQYESFMEKHHSLQQKEQQDIELSPDEIRDYEHEETELYGNSVIRKFLYAQREFSRIHSLVTQYVAKTIELDRLPEESELKKGGCGCGGSCGGGH